MLSINLPTLTNDVLIVTGHFSTSLGWNLVNTLAQGCWWWRLGYLQGKTLLSWWRKDFNPYRWSNAAKDGTIHDLCAWMEGMWQLLPQYPVKILSSLWRVGILHLVSIECCKHSKREKPHEIVTLLCLQQWGLDRWRVVLGVQSDQGGWVMEMIGIEIHRPCHQWTQLSFFSWGE